MSKIKSIGIVKNLNKILRYPERIPCDKRLNMLIGVVLVSILSVFTINVFIVIPTMVFVAWGIEFYQKLTKSGTYDNCDAIAVVVGGLIVYISHIL